MLLLEITGLQPSELKAHAWKKVRIEVKYLDPKRPRLECDIIKITLVPDDMVSINQEE